MSKVQEPIRSDRKPLQDLIPADQPLRVNIDPCDACNFRCHFCFQAVDHGFRGTMMSSELFRKIIDQLKEFERPINIIHLYGFGEPLLNRSIADFVKTVRDTGVSREIAITTNGSPLTHELSLALIGGGLTRLSVSLNGLSDKQFERITGISVSFEKLYEEIRFFYENRKQCHLHVKINGDDYTEEEQKKFVSLFEDCTDSMNIDHIANIWPDMKVTEQEAQNLYNLQLGDDGFVCPTMFYELVVHSDGTVSPCCMDYDFRHNNLGNVKETTLKEIWRGEKLKSIWVSELQGKTSPYPACNKCNKQANASVDITPYREEILGKF